MNGNTDSEKNEYETPFINQPRGEFVLEEPENLRKKPFQRPTELLTKKGTHLYAPVKATHSVLIVLLLGILLLFVFFTQLVEDDMPSPMTEESLGRNNIDRFSEERGWRYIMEIIGDSPRVAGTAYHLRKTNDLKRLIDEVAANATLPVHTDWQRVTGSYHLAYAHSFTNFYEDVSNLIALLEGESGLESDGTTRSSILVNCHYDSVPYSLGMSDDATFCGIMVEILSLMSRQPRKFKQNIVFLWNGAEENPLQGSHGFISHPWFKGVNTIINLEASGMNGKCNIFQMTDSRIMSAYGRVVSRPSAQSIGEFLFLAGVLPSDTDFRVWRDFGNLTGVDIAFVKSGHVYHTRNDHPSRTKPGVIQNAGDLLHRLLLDMANNEEFQKKLDSPQPAVYWDFLNTFVAHYSNAIAVVFDAVTLFVGLCSMAYYMWILGFKKHTMVELSFSILSRVLSAIGGLIIVFILTPIVIATTVQLRYLAQPWLLVPLYWIPYLVGAVAVSQVTDAWRAKRSGLNRCLRAYQAMAATRVILCLVVTITIFIPAVVSIRYALTVPLLLMSVTFAISLTFLRVWKLQPWHHTVLEFLLALPCTMWLFSLSLRMNSFMIPGMGRNLTNNPDWILAGMNAGLAFFVSMAMSGVELLFSRRRLWIVLSTLLAACVIIMFIPMSPYNEDALALQRHYWFHTEIISYNRNGVVTERVSGVLFTKTDTHTPESVLRILDEQGRSYSARTDFTDDCENYVYCNLPLARPRLTESLHQSAFIYGNPPQGVESSVRLVDKSCVNDVCRLSFSVIAPPHNIITLWPRPNATIRSWSLQADLIAQFQQLGRPVYVILHSHGTYVDRFPPTEFQLEISAPPETHNDVLIDISHHAHKVHHPEEFTLWYQSLLDAMPRYFNIASYLSVRSNYEF